MLWRSCERIARWSWSWGPNEGLILNHDIYIWYNRVTIQSKFARLKFWFIRVNWYETNMLSIQIEPWMVSFREWENFDELSNKFYLQLSFLQMKSTGIQRVHVVIHRMQSIEIDWKFNSMWTTHFQMLSTNVWFWFQNILLI